MSFETTVADLSPHHLFGLMVSALFWVWAVFKAFEAKAAEELPLGASAVFWLGMMVGIGLPIWFALGALAPVDPPFWLVPTAVASP